MERGRILRALFLGMGLLAACTRESSPDAIKLDDEVIAALPDERGTKRITPEQIEYLRKKQIPIVLVDSRPRAAHDLEHPAGAISIPLEMTERVGPTLPRDRLIVTLCT
ncbi:MAG: hypothetical protein H0V09_10040 [Gemmatimonadetes bacterium]|nr:hypothetical protein [Gemmatimonadota bacterium]